MPLLKPLNTPITNWQGRSVWLIGASSGIGLATAKALHAAGAQVVVSARNAELLQQFVDAHPGAQAVVLDVADTAAIATAARYVKTQQGLDVVMYCAGYYQAMRAADYSLSEMLRHLDINYTGALRVLDAVLPELLPQQRGHISFISSVAGFRGLPRSMAYGPTKAALINLAEALYYDVSPHGIGVSLINPGFVETPLVANNDFPMPALITPEKAAAEILSGWRKGQFHIHFPKRFTRMLLLLRLLPYRWYFALVRRGTGM
ncbi:MAG: short-chain dehydrogenase [Burkholderiales bacterium 35-55-47]|jgi:NAD(P)-dependent dehydrogenase (short-subunit alcohol dehydrogenase family)|uniref:SDR family NAD(P)-dependent oxidoreductase n=1 Tax=Limnohabitans sp. TaxID=1907725 RepID=UPI000BDCFE65|nr:SDR family NAD(P)-dependent oxidoreductase [Limnohabitans sp.]OYY18574.1 MAG: short-chain dehydrogenase [Burkholderiales bacterium 35-55-47]OYZ72985.1 MAG: short-chain dehydrogenase [Burkholderiales bacterium 24-55-52]OZA99344.1 MAG: short-chain dehydrogenase [Burkholderiales bacterium 39-55-53]HQR87243.1 SDR family NAD(P)-dependent oxidoreductase [Limnohabitans sp.]HQS27709.1 SDR family NAD(P)-dependent oxidoreductase [Limnohabitans sp.]